MILCFRLPDGASPDDFVVVPKVATNIMLMRASHCDSGADLLTEEVQAIYQDAILAAPPVKMCELPAHLPIERNADQYRQGYIDGRDETLDEIELRLA